MKQILIILLYFCVIHVVAQNRYIPSDHSTYITASIGAYGENYFRVEHDIIDEWIMAQMSILAGPNATGLQMKVGICKTWVIKRGETGKAHILRWYAYLPVLNYSISEGGYNTPLSTEVFYGRKQYQWSLNFDIYRDVVVPSVRFRCRLFHFRA